MKPKSTPHNIIRSYEKNVRLKYLGYSSYYEYLKSKHWREFTKSYFSDPNRKRCEICGKNYGLDLHHRDYSSLGRETFGDVVCLCKDHHKELHKKYRYKYKFTVGLMLQNKKKNNKYDELKLNYTLED